MADQSPIVARRRNVGSQTYSTDEVAEIMLHRKMKKDEEKADKRQRRESAVAAQEKEY